MIELECNAERDFAVPHGTILTIVIDVDGSWDCVDMVDTNATFTAEVDPGLVPVQVNQVFPTGQAGIFAGNDMASPQPVTDSGNILKISGSVTVTGPIGFEDGSIIPASLDATVMATIPAPTFGQWWGYGIVAASLGLLAVFALRNRSVRAAVSVRSGRR